MKEPKNTIRSLLQNEWDSANTSTVTPKFSTGWWDDNNDYPQVTVTNADEGPNPDTTTGQTKLGSTGMVGQNISGAVEVDCWANRESSDVNPKKLVYEFKQEARRIIQSNVTCEATSPTDLSDLNYLGWGGAIDRHATDITPVTYRKICEVLYGYHD